MGRGAAASLSGGIVGAQEAAATPSPEGAIGASRPPFIHRVGMDGVASVREEQVDVETHQFDCSTSIVIPEGEDSKPYIFGTVLNSGAEISCGHMCIA